MRQPNKISYRKLNEATRSYKYLLEKYFNLLTVYKTNVNNIRVYVVY